MIMKEGRHEEDHDLYRHLGDGSMLGSLALHQQPLRNTPTYTSRLSLPACAVPGLWKIAGDELDLLQASPQAEFCVIGRFFGRQLGFMSS